MNTTPPSAGRRWAQTLQHLNPRTHRGARWVGVVIIALIILVAIRDKVWFIHEGFALIRTAQWAWVGAAIAVAGLSFYSFAAVQRTLLSAAGVRVSRWRSVGLTLAANAWSATVPGGQAFSTALTYKVTRDWGASRVIASWQLLMSGVLAAIGLGLLGVAGLVLLGGQGDPVLLTGGIIMIVVLTGVALRGTRHYRVLEGPAVRIGRFLAAKRGGEPAADRMQVRVEGFFSQVAAIELSPRQLLTATVWSLINWLTDIVGLACAAWAIGAHPSAGALALAFVTGKLAGMLQITPGGVGTVDAALTSTLVAAGLPATEAFATVVVYRLINLVGAAAIGWVVFITAYARTTSPATTAE